MILVTGGSGVTGQATISELTRRGVTVRTLSRRGPVAPPPGVEVVAGDLADPDSLARAARGTTGIVHLACTYTRRDVDRAAMRALLAGWERGPFVYLSTLDVYGVPTDDPITEATPLVEDYTDYARGKVECERLLAGAGRRDWVALRAPYIWGPHPTARARLVSPRVEAGEPVILPGADEAEWREYRDVWIDARDLAAIIAACLERPPGEPLNVLSGHFVWHDLTAAVIRLAGSPSRIEHRPLEAIADDELPKKELYAQRWRFSEARLGATLGAIPRRPLAETLADTIAARS